MKPQDLIFFIVLAIILYIGKPKWLVIAGLICLLISIPLFSFWVFFTAQRLTYYALGFFLTSVIVFLIQTRRK